VIVTNLGITKKKVIKTVMQNWTVRERRKVKEKDLRMMTVMQKNSEIAKMKEREREIMTNLGIVTDFEMRKAIMTEIVMKRGKDWRSVINLQN
jgi:hypothetical protein